MFFPDSLKFRSDSFVSGKKQRLGLGINGRDKKLFRLDICLTMFYFVALILKFSASDDTGKIHSYELVAKTLTSKQTITQTGESQIMDDAYK